MTREIEESAEGFELWPVSGRFGLPQLAVFATSIALLGVVAIAALVVLLVGGHPTASVDPKPWVSVMGRGG
jgi:hypothetical protein